VTVTLVVARAAAGLLCLAAASAAQESPRSMTTLSAIVDSVERAGAQWDRDTTAVQIPTMYARAASGTSQRRCVETRGMQSVRSGDFAAWGQLTFATPKVIAADSSSAAAPLLAGWAASNTAKGARSQKVGWTPIHRPTPGGYHFEFWPVDQSATRPTINTSLAYTGDGQPPFISSGLSIAAPGTWVVVVTSGPDWGCFIFQKT
jgi:hypothetical protein